MSADLVRNGLQPSEPLWQRAPSRDADGRLLSDFMMLIPRLSRAPALRRERVCAELRAVFRSHADAVRFADLNLRLNLVWISLEASPGLIREVAGAIRRRIPEAVLIGHECGVLAPDPPPGMRARLGRIRDRILRLGGRRRALAAPDSGPR